MPRVAIGFLVLLLAAGCNERRGANSPTSTNKQIERPMSGSPQTMDVSSDANASQPPQVKVFLNPLVMLLAGAEKQKGRPLTREEVLQIRDTAVSVMMSPEQAEKFYKSLDAQVPVRRMNPARVWEEWQEIRDQMK
jgi:hypothetical protein